MRRLFFFGITVFLILGFGFSSSAQWYDPDWDYRVPVTITNTSASPLTYYQVLIELDGSFNFVDTLPGGDDLRVTSFDAETEIPFWIESWNEVAQEALVWVQVPSILASGSTTIYLYYGNSSAPAASDGGATFVFFDDDWFLGNPIHTMAGEGPWVTDYVSYPNIFKEGDTYYMLYDGHTPHQKGLATSSDLINWESLPNPVVTNSGISGAWDQTGVAWGDTIKVGGTYYMLVAGLGGDSRWRIGVETSADCINWDRAPAGATNPVLVASETWEGGSGGSLSGTAVLKELDGITPVLHEGQYWMAYHDYAGPYQIGLASAPSPLGPWTKHTANPILSPNQPWESSGLWVTSMVREGDKYYIFYYGRSGWFHMGYAWCNVDDFPGTASDWTKTTDYILGYGPTGTWDDTDHEDPMIRKFDDMYYLFYTGKGTRYANGFATGPAIEGPFTKFDGYWLVGGNPEVSDGLITFTGEVSPGDSVESPDLYTPGYAMGYRANFVGPDNYKWGGFLTSPHHPPFAYIGTTGDGANSGELLLTTYDTSISFRWWADLGLIPDEFHVYEVAWLSGLTEASIDHAFVDFLTDAVPAGPLPIQFRNYNDTAHPFEVDWVYLRKCSAYTDEPSSEVGEQEVRVILVEIDIKPGDYPNSINLCANGVVPIAILTDSTFDATTVDPDSVVFAGAAIRVKGKGAKQYSIEDVDGDGDLDFVAQISVENLELDYGSTDAVVAGMAGGVPFEGTDLVNIVKDCE